jgi:RimJ/RimL family protein N-acetyltransferase
MATLEELISKNLYTPRLTLQLYDHSASHFQCIFSALHSPTAHATMGDHSAKTQAEFDASTLDSRIRHPKFKDGVADDDCMFMVRLGPNNSDGPLIGVVSLSQSDGRPVDMGWALCEGYKGHGYATEAAARVIRWAREDLGVEDLAVFPSETNHASNRVAEKLGFVSGGKVAHEHQPGKWRNVLILPKGEIS